MPGNYRGSVIATTRAEPPRRSRAAWSPSTVSPPLAGTLTFAPTKVVDNSGAVKFDVAAAGATEWSWDFGDSGGVFGPWISDPDHRAEPDARVLGTGDKIGEGAGAQLRRGSGDQQRRSSINVPLVNPLVASFAETDAPAGSVAAEAAPAAPRRRP